jgi:hypothetical protein
VNRGHRNFRHQIHCCWTFAYPTLSIFDAVTAVVSRRPKMPVWTYNYRFEVVRIEVWRDA